MCCRAAVSFDSLGAFFMCISATSLKEVSKRAGEEAAPLFFF